MSEGGSSFYTIGPLPEIIIGSLHVPTYHLVLSLTYSLAIFWFYQRCESRNLPQKQAMTLALLLLGFGFLGARLVHVVYEMPRYYIQNPWDVFAIWQGGFVYYGGALLGYLACFLYLRRDHVLFWLWHDTIAPVLALGYALGRTACQLTGCCYGKVCDLPWATSLKQVHIGSGNVTHLTRHPTPLYASAFEFVVLLFLLWYEKRRPPMGRVFLILVILHATGRIVMEVFRDDPRGPSLGVVSLSTGISVALIVAAAALIYRQRPMKE